MKNKNFIQTILLGLGAITLALGGLACGRKNQLQPLETLYLVARTYVTVNAQFCMASPADMRQRVKYIFVIDKSYSNFSQNSDPTGFRRYSRLAAFLNNAILNPPPPGDEIWYSLVNFSTGSTLRSPFTMNPSQVLSAVNQDWNNGLPTDFGDTDYLGAIQQIYNMIEADLRNMFLSAAPTDVSTRYVVAFVTDGAPFTNGQPQNTQAIYDSIDVPGSSAGSRTLMSLKSGPYAPWVDDIIFNTAIYYPGQTPIDPQAVPILQQMALLGGGEFLQFGGGQVIDFMQFATPRRNVRYELADVFVENASSNWFYTPTRVVDYLLDSDHDGLPNLNEANLNSNPNDPDTDKNGVSDYVEYTLIGRPCNDPGCAAVDPLRSVFATCSGLLNRIPLPNEVLTFNDSDKDGLNDCEELLLKGNRYNFDTNGDRIPDFLSLKANLPFISGLTGVNADPDADGQTSYAELKENTPNFMSNSRVPNLKLPKYEIKKLPIAGNDTTEVDCYQLRAENVAALGWDNLIRVHVVQNLAISDNKPILKTAQGKLQGKSKSITFSRGDFQ